MVSSFWYVCLCPSICPKESAQLPLNVLSRNLIYASSLKTLLDIRSSAKMGQIYVVGDTISPNMSSLRVKWCHAVGIVEEEQTLREIATMLRDNMLLILFIFLWFLFFLYVLSLSRFLRHSVLWRPQVFGISEKQFKDPSVPHINVVHPSLQAKNQFNGFGCYWLYICTEQHVGYRTDFRLQYTLWHWVRCYGVFITQNVIMLFINPDNDLLEAQFVFPKRRHSILTIMKIRVV
jgi:hypothetical protein